MAIDTARPRTRRALLGAGLSVIAASVAATLGRAQPASAHDPDDVRLGTGNSASTQTEITNTGTDTTAFAGFGSGLGAGVVGSSSSGTGVYGTSQSSNGVFGFSVSGNAISGVTLSAGASAVYGENNDEGYGVAGRSNSRPLGTGGVFAAATLGDNTADGVGVWARSSHGIGLYADAANPDAVAFRANGVTRFARSGRLTIAVNQSSVTKTGIRVDTGTLVLATLQQHRGGVWIESAEPNAAGNSFTVRLNKVVATDTTVGWFLVN